MNIYNSFLNTITITLLSFLIFGLVIPFVIDFIFIQAHEINFRLYKRKIDRMFKYANSTKNKKGCILGIEARKYVNVEYKIYEYNFDKIENFRNKIAYWRTR